MNRILIVIFFSISTLTLMAEKSPHGKNFTMDCAVCHTTNAWKTIKENGFNHNQTKFKLTGQHKQLKCKSCHDDLQFKNQDMRCAACHQDVHEQTLGDDCERCHQTSSWMVSDVKGIHREMGFPLLGIHATLDCNNCHTSANELKFEKMSADCYSCHRQDYEQTTTPNHKTTGFDTDCLRCHNQSSNNWSGAGFEHSFFPLQGGHQLDCAQCHTDGYNTKLSTECSSCHQADYQATTNPPHASSGFSTDCKTCHTIQSWKPATFDHDKLYFPIYSGKHQGEWSKCTDCHKNTSNYASFTCTDCHEHNKSKMDNEHDDVRNYVYNSPNCYACHPRGNAD